MDKFRNAITDVPEVLVGQCQDSEALTGCSVVICPDGATGGVDQRGGAPGTRETDLLRPMHLVQKIHAVLLAGGSAFGLDAAAGVMRYLEEKQIGFNTGVAIVPIVSAAILFDLGLGNPLVRPDATMGYEACLQSCNQPPAQGNVGAGTGATVGKLFGMKNAMKSGIGTASVDVGGGVIVGALVAVNAFGDVIDPTQDKIIAGARTPSIPLFHQPTSPFADTLKCMKSLPGRTILAFASKQNTTIGVVATNARLTKEEATKVAQMAQNGLALTLRPAHTMLDGDTIFVLATGKKRADVNIVGAFACQAVAHAILNAVMYAESLHNFPAASSIW